MSIASIKAAIKTDLDALVTATTLAGVTVSDFKQDPLSNNAGTFPHAFLMTPAVESSGLDNRTNVRTYSFPIMVIFQAENITTTDLLETKIEAILTQFDNDPTLGGTAMAGIEPVSSSPQPFQHGGKDLVMVIVEITAKELVSLTFS